MAKTSTLNTVDEIIEEFWNNPTLVDDARKIGDAFNATDFLTDHLRSWLETDLSYTSDEADTWMEKNEELIFDKFFNGLT